MTMIFLLAVLAISLVAGLALIVDAVRRAIDDARGASHDLHA